MDTPTFTQAVPLSQLLPNLTGLLSKNEIESLTATVKKRARPTMHRPQTVSTTAVKVEETPFRPLSVAEMRASLAALKPYSPRRNVGAQTHPSTKKKGWNSSVKVDFKKISHTANGQLKNNPVRKALNFQQPKPKDINSRMTMQNNTNNIETPKFPKPETIPKKSALNFQAKNTVRISGICKIPPTPLETARKPVATARNINFNKRLTVLNKENVPKNTNIPRNTVAPTPILKTPKLYKKTVSMTPLSWKSGSDASFLVKEKEINDIEAERMALTEEKTLENVAEISPTISTPFKEYRSIQDFFNNSSMLENSALYNENTIMSFDKPSSSNDDCKKDESIIVSLCDLFNKAAVTNSIPKENTELENLIEMKNQAEQSIKMIETGIQLLSNIKESHIKSLENIRKLIKEKTQDSTPESKVNKTLVGEKCAVTTETTPDVDTSPIISRPCSVIKSTRSPSYKIPKKIPCLRKKVICKSLSNVSNNTTPVKVEGEALDMYMKMKQNMNFLSTPVMNRTVQISDTPAVTSHNLQKQLDKLYNGS